MAYPRSNIRDDVQDAPFGGASGSDFGQPAWQFHDDVLQFLESYHLSYARAPNGQAVLVVQGGGSAGDALMDDLNQTAAGAYYATKATSTGGGKRFAGVLLEPVSAGAKGRVAQHGTVPASVTGLGADSGPYDVGVNPSTGRLRKAITGDTIVARADANGNALLVGVGSQL